MERNIQIHNDYRNAAFAFALLSLIGSILSLINIITLLITYELLQDAREKGLSQKQDKFINTLFQTALLLTFCVTILYLSIQF